MIPTLRLAVAEDRQRVQSLLDRLRLDPVKLALSSDDPENEAVRKVLADVARRGDEAVVEISQRFDDPNFTAEQIRVSHDEMHAAAGRITPQQSVALRRSIDQVREYQQHVLPKPPTPLHRP